MDRQPRSEVLADAFGPVAAAGGVIALGLKGDRIRPVDQAVVVDVVISISLQLEAIVLQFGSTKRLDALIVRGLCVYCHAQGLLLGPVYGSTPVY